MSGLLSNPAFMAGIGLLSGNTPQRTPVNPIQNMMGGLQQAGQAQARDRQLTMQEQFRQAQMQKMQAEQQAEQAASQNLEAAIASYPPEQQARIRANPSLIGLPEKPKPIDYNKPFLPDGTPNKAYQDYSVNKSAASAPTVNLPPNMPYELEKGFLLKDASDPSKGITPIPGSGKDEVSAADAAKVQMMRTAQESYKGVEELLYDEDGTPNYKNLAMAKGNVPYSDGRELSTRMEYGIQAITRAETGAAMPAEEVENTRKRFMPSPLDNAETIKLKLDMYKDFVSGNIKLIDPSGRFNEKRFESEWSLRSKHDTELSVNDLLEKYK